MLRITRVNERDLTVTLKVEGPVATEGVEVLERACASSLRDRVQLRLDVSDVDYIDPAGVTMLKRLMERGVTIESASLIVASLLTTEEDETQ